MVFLTLCLTAVWAGTVAWFLCGDRPRGRRRCPFCWYCMDGHLISDTDDAAAKLVAKDPLAAAVARIPCEPRCCPECGRTPRRFRDYYRVRPRWGRALIVTGVFVPVIVGTLLWSEEIGKTPPEVVAVPGE